MAWEAGENLTSFLIWARNTGADTLRVFLQHKFLRYPVIQPYIMNLTSIRPMCEWFLDRNWYLELTMLCDTQKRNPGDDQDGFDQSDDQCIDRVGGILNEVRGLPNIFAEVMNEPWFNGGVTRLGKIIERLKLRDPTYRPVLMSSGLYPDTGSEPRESMFPLDYCGDHPKRKPSWPSETGKSGMYQYRQLGVPIVQDEPMGCAEEASGSRDPNPDNWEDAGAGMALSSAGGTFHSQDAMFIQVPGPKQIECGRRFFRAMDAISLDAPTWEWAHDDMGNHPLVAVKDESIAGEIVSRINGNYAETAAAQPSSRWDPQPLPGWRIVDRKFERRTILKLER